jgi:TIR domain
MILVLHENGLETVSDTIVQELTVQYGTNSAIQKVASEAVWDRHVEWDDLLVVVYQSDSLPAVMEGYIRTFREVHPSVDPQTREKQPGGFVIPVCTSGDPVRRRPPPPLSGIRSALYDGSEQALSEIVRAVGVFLGMALRPGNQHIFIAYRASDGKELAREVHDRLEAAGFKPWLDVAKDNLAIGDTVQDEIRAHIQQTAMLLILDTPDAPESPWMTLEVETAIGLLIPVIPVVVGNRRNSRFVPLQSLQRCAVVQSPVLTDESWVAIWSEIEGVLLESSRRRLRILNVAKHTFTETGFAWDAVDAQMRIYLAQCPQAMLPTVVVLSHCSVHDITYTPALRAYGDYIRQYPSIATVNHKLCIYDRDRFLSEPEWRMISRELPHLDFILAHHNQLPMLIHTHFTRLS